MPTDVIMPALGVAQEKGTLLNWHKAEGQSVTKGEPLMEIETDKATVEIEAPASGILTNVTASAGDEVPVGNRIAVILAPGEVAAPPTEGKGRGEDRLERSTHNLRSKPAAEPNPPMSPFIKGGSEGDFASKLHLLVARAYSRPPQLRELRKREASTSHPSKVAGLAAALLPKML